MSKVHFCLLLLVAYFYGCQAQLDPNQICKDEVKASAECLDGCVCSVNEVAGVLLPHILANGISISSMAEVFELYQENDQLYCNGTKKVMEACLESNKECTYQVGSLTLSYEVGLKDGNERCGFGGGSSAGAGSSSSSSSSSGSSNENSEEPAPAQKSQQKSGAPLTMTLGTGLWIFLVCASKMI